MQTRHAHTSELFPLLFLLPEILFPQIVSLLVSFFRCSFKVIFLKQLSISTLSKITTFPQKKLFSLASRNVYLFLTQYVGIHFSCLFSRFIYQLLTRYKLHKCRTMSLFVYYYVSRPLNDASTLQVLNTCSINIE